MEGNSRRVAPWQLNKPDKIILFIKILIGTFLVDQNTCITLLATNIFRTQVVVVRFVDDWNANRLNLCWLFITFISVLKLCLWFVWNHLSNNINYNWLCLFYSFTLKIHGRLLNFICSLAKLNSYQIFLHNKFYFLFIIWSDFYQIARCGSLSP